MDQPHPDAAGVEVVREGGGNAAPFHAARDLLLRLREDPAAAVAGFAWPVLDRFNWALDHFDHLPPEAPALRFTGALDRRLTFGALRDGSNRHANHLRRLGVARGDRVLVLLGNVPELWLAMLALMKLGAVVIPATTLLTEADLADRFSRGRVKHVIADAALAPRFSAMPEGVTRIAVGATVPGWHDFAAGAGEPAAFAPEGETRATDPLLLYFTSGTTSKPKLVLHTHQSYPVGHLSTVYWQGLRPRDVHLNVSSPGWAKHAWSSFFAPWIVGACIVVPTDARFDPRALLDTLVAERVTTFCAPPTVWRMLVQQDLTRWRVSIREALAAGEPLNPEVIETVRRAWGLVIRDGYGQTETTLQIANTPGAPVTPGSMGRPLPGYRVALLDEAGAEAEEGEIALSLDPRPLGLMVGYQQEDGSVRGVEGPWYRTGDTALRNPDGSLTYVGRADDVFKSAGYRISPFEIESALIEHPAVAEAAVIPSADPVRGTVPKAVVMLADGHAPDQETARAVLAHLRATLAPYKRVRRIEFAELPKTISGKIRRVQLRRVDAAQRQDGERGEAEFWEEDFPELSK